MDLVRAVADGCIRRGLGFVGLAVGTIMLSFSFDPLLALRSAAVLLACTTFGLAWNAWRAPHRDVRRGEVWTMLGEGAFVRSLPRPDAQSLLAGVMRERFLWHADRVGAATLLVFVLAWLLQAARWLSG